ncbi:MAG: hypothetical protein AAFU80_25905 [Pseudomonadota bacterium]
MSIELAFPFIALGIAVAGAIYFRHEGKKLDARIAAERKRHHPAE